MAEEKNETQNANSTDPRADVEQLCRGIAGLTSVRLQGLMTIGPWTANEGCIRKAFEFTRQTFEEMRRLLGPPITVLSMGMSSDYELAIECGSTMVRVGTAIFGTR